MKPIIALDVDGVLAPLGSYQGVTPAMASVWPSEVWQVAPNSYNMRVAAPVVTFFRRLHEEERAIIFWHTSWRERAQNTLAKDLSLPEWELLEDVTNFLKSPEWWKLDDVMKRLADGHRVIWLDDDIAESEEVLEAGLPARADVFMISPHLKEGLREEHLTAVEDKLKEWERA